MDKLKVLILNSKGGVGKSTVGMQVIAPYIYEKWQTKALFVELDDENDDVKAFEQSSLIDGLKLAVTGELRDKVTDILLGDRHTIIDVGANKTATQTLHALCDTGIIHAVNLIVIPLMDGEQDASNAAMTYFTIRQTVQNVPILFVLNRYNAMRDVNVQFDSFLGCSRGFFDEGGVIASFSPEDRRYVTLVDSDVIKYARKFGLSVYELVKLNRDLETELKLAIQERRGPKEIKYISFKLSLRKDAQRYYDEVLKTIFDTLDGILFYE